MVSRATAPARTLLDLAATGLRGRPLEAALDRAELLRVLDFAELQRLLALPEPFWLSSLAWRRCPATRPGLSKRAACLEELVLELCDDHGLPRPNVNCNIERKVRYLHWPGSRLVVRSGAP